MGAHWNNEQILREEIFSIERLEQHAESLAAAQTITRQPGFRRSLGARLRGNEKALLTAYRSIAHGTPAPVMRRNSESRHAVVTVKFGLSPGRSATARS